MSTRTIMPIMGATLLSEVPWGFIAPHEAQAQSNHGQSLVRLAQRGGLAVCEVIDIVEGRRWGSSKPCIENETYLINKVRAWKATQVKPMRVACITLDGTTLTIPAEAITDFGIGEDDGHTYTLTFKTMTRAEFDALGEFDGF